MLMRLSSAGQLLPPILSILLVGGLGWYYYAGAVEHARLQNTSKARGDQSAYLADAQLIHRNWHGANDPPIRQPRNRMPLYPAFLASIYDPTWSDAQFFDEARARSVYLSLALLGIIALLAFGHLQAHPAANFTLTVAFGYFVFKAGYVQAELLFYTLSFATFVMFWHALLCRGPKRTAIYTIGGGVLAALAHLTKASMLPLAVIFLVVLAFREAGLATRERKPFLLPWRAAAVVLFAVSFLGVLYPYLATSKRANRQYFYNLNTSLLMWYDAYPEASVDILTYGPDGWPQVRAAERPGPRKYWRDHSAREIGARFADGFRDMVVRSYTTYWYFKFVAVYLGFAVVLIVSRRTDFAALVRRHAALAAFLALYAAVYLPSIAFYEPISGTGTARFLLAHVAPLLFALSKLCTHPELQGTRWTVARVTLSPVHFHMLVSILWALDLTFTLWPRLMTTYGGF
jgi:hypothetical protein